MAQKLNSKYQIIFTEEATEKIQEILKRYGLEMFPKISLEKIKEAKSSEEKESLFEGLPGRVLAKTVKELAEDKIKIKDSISMLEKKLNIPNDKAEKLARDIEKEVLIYAKKIPIEKEAPPTEPSEITLTPEKTSATPNVVSSEIKPKEKTPPPKSEAKDDTYRESIE